MRMKSAKPDFWAQRPPKMLLTFATHIYSDELSTDALSARSLTFLICHRYLFKTVAINLNHDTINENCYRKLYGILCDNPQIGTFVRGFQIMINHNSTAFETLPQTLCLLPNFHHFIVKPKSSFQCFRQNNSPHAHAPALKRISDYCKPLHPGVTGCRLVAVPETVTTGPEFRVLFMERSCCISDKQRVLNIH